MTRKSARGQTTRAEWAQLPERVRSAVNARLGSPAVSAINQAGGFSPGMAARITTAAGDRVFVKAVGPELNPDSPGIFRHEAYVAGGLPLDAPAPRLLWSWDEGEGGWVVLAFEEIDGRMPELPWRAQELDPVLFAMEKLSDLLTPSPMELGSASDFFAESICGWRLLQEGDAVALDDWSNRHLDGLVELESGAPEAVGGHTLLHLDIRDDNIVLSEARVYFVDWPWARVGAAWVDFVGFAPSVCLQGGPAPEELADRFPLVREAEPLDVTRAIASIAGLFTHRSLQPPPPGIPTLRQFQAAQGAIARQWLAERTGWK